MRRNAKIGAALVERAVLVPSGPWKVLDAKGRPVCDTDTNPRRMMRGVQLCRETGAQHFILSGNSMEMERLEEEAKSAIHSEAYRPKRKVSQHGGVGVRMNTFLNVFLAAEYAHGMRIEEIFVATSELQIERMMVVGAGINVLSRRYLDWEFRMHCVPCDPPTLEEVVEFERTIAAQEPEKLRYERMTLSAFADELKSWRRHERAFLPRPKSLDRSVPQTITRIEQVVSSS